MDQTLPPSTDRLLRELQCGEAAERASAAGALERFTTSSREVVAALCFASKDDPSPAVREAARRALQAPAQAEFLRHHPDLQPLLFGAVESAGQEAPGRRRMGWIGLGLSALVILIAACVLSLSSRLPRLIAEQVATARCDPCDPMPEIALLDLLSKQGVERAAINAAQAKVTRMGGIYQEGVFSIIMLGNDPAIFIWPMR